MKSELKRHQRAGRHGDLLFLTEFIGFGVSEASPRRASSCDKRRKGAYSPSRRARLLDKRGKGAYSPLHRTISAEKALTARHAARSLLNSSLKQLTLLRLRSNLKVGITIS